MNSYSIEYEKIKEIINIEEATKLKIYAVNSQNYELAAAARDQELFLQSEKGIVFVRKYKRIILEKKLKRILKKKL